MWSHGYGPKLGVDPEELYNPSTYFPFASEKKYLAMVYDDGDKKKEKEDEILRDHDGLIVSQIFPEHKYAIVTTERTCCVHGGRRSERRIDAADFILTKPDLRGIVRAIEILKVEKDHKCVVC